jgi:benzylsuccinate CoA-transferase BbsF subunit
MKKRSERLPLEGVRVIDLGTAWSAPICAKYLALNGAEVIHLEDFRRPDVSRFGDYPENKTDNDYFWETGGRYHATNCNKSGISINLNDPKGVKWFKELIKISDVVLDNFSPRVMPQLGLDYAMLCKVKPDIIMCSISAFGYDGPWTHYKGYGPITEATSGIINLSGSPDRAPVLSRIVFADPPAAIMAYFAIVAALYNKLETGKGRWIDLSQYEVLTNYVGQAILEYNMGGKEETRRGNRHPFMAPHGCYRCRGTDNWITIAVSTEEEWQHLCSVLGNPAWTKEQRFSEAAGRFENQDELDKLIEAWTVNKDHYEAMQILQKHGIDAGAVLNAKEILTDQHVRERQCFQIVDYSESRKGLGVGKRLHLGLPWRMSNVINSFVKSAPRLGQDNHKIIVELLGATEEEYAELKAEEVVGDNLPPSLIKGMRSAVPYEKLVEQGIITGYDIDYKEKLGI